MSAQSSESHALDAQAAHEAAQWLVRLHGGVLSGAEEQALQTWRASSAQREEAWQRAMRLVQRIEIVAGRPGGAALRNLARGRRRDAVKLLALALTAAPLVWTAQREAPAWLAQERTATGERRRIVLADGS